MGVEEAEEDDIEEEEDPRDEEGAEGVEAVLAWEMWVGAGEEGGVKVSMMLFMLLSIFWLMSTTSSSLRGRGG